MAGGDGEDVGGRKSLRTAIILLSVVEALVIAGVLLFKYLRR